MMGGMGGAWSMVVVVFETDVPNFVFMSTYATDECGDFEYPADDSLPMDYEFDMDATFRIYDPFGLDVLSVPHYQALPAAEWKSLVQEHVRQLGHDLKPSQCP